MKQNKRFWLVALVVLLAMTLVSGLALAADPYIDEVKAGEESGQKTSYTYYAIDKYEKENKWCQLIDSRTGVERVFSDKTIPVQLSKVATAGDIQFTYHATDGVSFPEEKELFFFDVSPKGLYVDAAGKKSTTETPSRSVNLLWDGVTPGTFSVKVIAANGVTKYSELPTKTYSVTFSITIKPASLVGLQIVNDRFGDNTFTYNLTNVAYIGEPWYEGRAETDKLQIVTEYKKGYRDGEGNTNVQLRHEVEEEDCSYDAKTEITNMYVRGLKNRDEDVQFDIVYDPANLVTIEKGITTWHAGGSLVGKMEKDLAGFLISYSNTSVGNRKYDDGKTREYSWLEWNNKPGSVNVTITPVDKYWKQIKELGTDTGTLIFKELPEEKITIKVFDKPLNNKDKKEIPVRILKKSTIDIYNEWQSSYIYNAKYEEVPYYTEIIITDKQDNATEPTYVNKYTDLVWSSSDPEIIRVTKDGRITGLKKGTAYAKATGHFGVVGQIKVEVFDAVPSKITAIKFNQEPAEYEIPVRSYRPVHAYVITTPESTEYTAVSSDPDILSIDRDDTGTLFMYAKKKGTVTVTVTPYEKPELAITATVTVVPTVTGIAFTQDSFTVTRGEEKDLYLTVTPRTATFNEKLYNVSFDPEGIVDYDDEDSYTNSISVTGLKSGTTKVTVTKKDDETVTATTTVIVKGIPAKSIKLKKDSITLYAVSDKSSSLSDGYTATASFHDYVVVNPANAEEPEDNWQFVSDSNDVAVVNEYGAILAVGEGVAKITGKYDDGLNTAELVLTVNVKGTKKAEPTEDPEPSKEPAKSNPIVVEPEDGIYQIDVVKGWKNEKQLIVYDAVTGEEVDVKWASKDTKMATVSKAGVVKAKGKGSVVITATTLDGTQKYEIGLTLNQKPVKQIKVLFNKVELKVGEKFIVGASVYPKHSYNQELGYKSSNKKVVTVDGGILTAKKPGTATITISAKDGSGVKATVEVTVVK